MGLCRGWRGRWTGPGEQTWASQQPRAGLLASVTHAGVGQVRCARVHEVGHVRVCCEREGSAPNGRGGGAAERTETAVGFLAAHLARFRCADSALVVQVLQLGRTIRWLDAHRTLRSGSGHPGRVSSERGSRTSHGPPLARLLRTSTRRPTETQIGNWHLDFDMVRSCDNLRASLWK